MFMPMFIDNPKMTYWNASAPKYSTMISPILKIGARASGQMLSMRIVRRAKLKELGVI